MNLCNLKKIQSPLRRFGGKFYLANTIISYFPETKIIVSPFLGGGSIELKCARENVEIIANDIDPYVINTWKHFQENRDELLNILVEEYVNISREHWFELKNEYIDNKFTLDIEGAAKYIALNKSAYQAIMSKNIGFTRGISNEKTSQVGKHNRWNIINYSFIDTLDKVKYKYFDLNCLDWFEFLKNQNEEIFIYLDPPYYQITKKYFMEFSESDHQRLKEFLSTRPNWILSYKFHPYIIDLYREYKMKQIEIYNTSTNRYDCSSNTELIIMSRDFDEPM